MVKLKKEVKSKSIKFYAGSCNSSGTLDLFTNDERIKKVVTIEFKDPDVMWQFYCKNLELRVIEE